MVYIIIIIFIVLYLNVIASLGISYLEKFFNISRDINDLKNSLKAYTIAVINNIYYQQENIFNLLLVYSF